MLYTIIDVTTPVVSKRSKMVLIAILVAIFIITPDKKIYLYIFYNIIDRYVTFFSIIYKVAFSGLIDYD